MDDYGWQLEPGNVGALIDFIIDGVMYDRYYLEG